MRSMRRMGAQAGRALILSPNLRSAARRRTAPAPVAANCRLGFVTNTRRPCESVTQVVDPATGRHVTGLVEASVELDTPFTFLIPIPGGGRTVPAERQRFRFAA